MEDKASLLTFKALSSVLYGSYCYWYVLHVRTRRLKRANYLNR